MSPFQAEELRAGFPKFSLFPASWLDAEDPLRPHRPKKIVETLGGSITSDTGTVKRGSNKSTVLSH